MPLGLYVSVPFCRTKCSYCNFASDVFSRTRFQRYTDRLVEDVRKSPALAQEMGARFDHEVDSIYLGGGTPSLLAPSDLERLFAAISQTFQVLPGAEVTVECAPGTLTSPVVECLVACGVNRISLGVQSFVDQESRSVGRMHTRAVVLDDITRLREAGISNINIDLIAGLPHQSHTSWSESLAETLATSVPHVSVYMLEVDEDSRLGRELIAGGTRYHAHTVPDEDATADFYAAACDELDRSGVRQYEISNFAREEMASRHNMKYWNRQPYMGFGVDAHSMLRAENNAAIRFSTPDVLDDYMAGAPLKHNPVTVREAMEETFFLGLRLNRGVDLKHVEQEFGPDAVAPLLPVIADLVSGGLLGRREHIISLTQRGRLLSNEVFERFIGAEARLAAS
jgi:oxygen-independent coproporphyrinogen III oxidase